jgi:inner membrane protein
MRASCATSARRSWVTPVLLAVVALAFDAVNRLIPYGVFRTGPVDEVAHLATAALGLLVIDCFVAAPRRFYVAALLASVAIDLDHIPSYLWTGPEVSRPVTHSLATVVVVALAAWLLPRHRAVLVGVCVGLVFHFARDITEGVPGVRLFWPLDQSAWTGNRVEFIAIVLTLLSVRLTWTAFARPRGRTELSVGAQS